MIAYSRVEKRWLPVREVAVGVLVVAVGPQQQAAGEEEGEGDQARDGGAHEGGGSGAVSGVHRRYQHRTGAADATREAPCLQEGGCPP